MFQPSIVNVNTHSCLWEVRSYYIGLGKTHYEKFILIFLICRQKYSERTVFRLFIYFFFKEELKTPLNFNLYTHYFDHSKFLSLEDVNCNVSVLVEILLL